MSQTEIQKGWKSVKLGEIGEYKYGYNGKASLDKNEKPYLRITDINEDGSLKSDRVYVHISDNDFEKYNLKNNDIVIARTGATVGKSFLFKGSNDFVFASYLIRFRFDVQKIMPQFLSYVLKSHAYWNFIGLSQSVGAQPNVNATKMSNFEFLLPPLETQKQIVQKLDHILGQLEEKKKQIFSLIEQNKERINFFVKNWFAYLIDNEIRKKIEHKKLELVLLQDITDSIGDGIHTTPNYTNNSNFYFINGSNLRNGSIAITHDTKMVDESEYQKYKLNLNKNTILLSINGTIGNLAFYKNEQVILGKSACYINCSDVLKPEFLFYLLQSNMIKKYFKNELTKTSIPNLSLKSIRMTTIPLPTISIQTEIVKNIKNTEEKFKSQKTQFENIKENYESKIKYINHIQSSILNSAFSGKLVN